MKKTGRATKVDKANKEVIEKQGYKIGKDGNSYKCRFGFPKPTIGYDHVYTDTYEGPEVLIACPRNPKVAPEGGTFTIMQEDPTKLELKLLRNHPHINSHIPEIGLIWKGQTDAAPVRSAEQAEEYLTKYMTKNPEASKDHERALKSVVSKKNANIPAKSAVQSMFMEMTKMDKPKEAACLEILKHRHYMEFSVPIRHVSLGHLKKLDLDKEGHELVMADEKSMADAYFNRDQDENFAKLCEEYEKDPKEYYRKLAKFQPEWKYPVEPKEISLYWYVAYFTKGWKMTVQQHCPHFTPAFKRPPNKFSNPEGHALWARATMLQHIPGVKPETLQDEFESINDAMHHFVYESGYCPNLEKEKYEKACINRKELGLAEEDEEDEEEELQEPELCPSIEGK